MVKVDQQFSEVIDACRFRGPDQGTWITDEMAQAYRGLFDAGYAHSIECYIDEELVGGLYGISLGNLFFGESMFHHVTDASKIAFAHLMQLMASVGCPLVDCQIPNPHLESLGTVEVSRREFKLLLESGADIDVKDKNQRTALDWALSSGHTEIIRMLRQAGGSRGRPK